MRQALADPESIFYYYQMLIRLRKQQPVIVYGRYDLLLEHHGQIYAFTRTLGDERLLVLLNFRAEIAERRLPEELALEGAEMLIGNYPLEAGEAGASVTLRYYEARVYGVRSHRS